MNLESNYAIAIAKLIVIGLKKGKPKPIATCMCSFSSPLGNLHRITTNLDWFTALFAPVVVARSNYFGIRELKHTRL